VTPADVEQDDEVSPPELEQDDEVSPPELEQDESLLCEDCDEQFDEDGDDVDSFTVDELLD